MKKEQGYRVSYHQLTHNGKYVKGVTAIVYPTKAAAQRYADQLNRGLSYKNARVRKA